MQKQKQKNQDQYIQDPQNDDIRIKVELGEQKQQFGGVYKYHLYAIFGKDKYGQFNCVRRSTDFQILKIVLVNQWPGIFIPSLPQKQKIIPNNQNAFLQIRRQTYLRFLLILSQMPYIWNANELQTFLRTNQDCQKSLFSMKQINLPIILKRYQQAFPQLYYNSNSKEIKQKINEFGKKLKTFKQIIGNLQKKVQNIYFSRKKANEIYNNLLSAILPQYETLSIKNQSQSLGENKFSYFFNLNQGKKQKNSEIQKRKQNNNIAYILQQIKRQKAQISAFEQIFKVKKYFFILKNRAISKQKDLQIQKSKINSGRQSLISKFQKISKQDQLKQNQFNINKTQEQGKNLTLLYEVIIKIIGYKQIEIFKKIRQQSYYQLLKKYCDLQIQQSKNIKEYWCNLNLNLQKSQNQFDKNKNNFI